MGFASAILNFMRCTGMRSQKTRNTYDGPPSSTRSSLSVRTIVLPSEAWDIPLPRGLIRDSEMQGYKAIQAMPSANSLQKTAPPKPT